MANDAKLKRRKTRPNKRDLQKIKTRRAILQTGREIFASSGVALPTVEDVTKAAGISRQAFYLHFKSRDDLLLKLFDREVRWHMRLYRSLGTPDAADERKLVSWIKSIMDAFANQKHYITIMKRALAMDQTLLGQIFQERRRFILHMGRTIPQFGIFEDDGSVDEERVTEMQFLLLQVENLSEYNAFGAWSEPVDFSIRLLAQKFLEFASVDCGQPERKRSRSG